MGLRNRLPLSLRARLRMLGGILLIEARDLNEAVRIAAGIPFARLGFIEVRPLVDYSQPRPKL